MKLLNVFIFTFFAAVTVFAKGTALTVDGAPVTFLLPDNIGENITHIAVIETDRNGRALRQKCDLLEIAVADPEIRIRRALRFTPRGKGVRKFRFDIKTGNTPVKYERENLLPTGDFEKKGWWLGNLNPGTVSLGMGRNGGKALQVDCRVKTNGGPANAGTSPAELMKLRDPENIPAVLRVYTKTVEAPEGIVGGMTLRMRRFTLDEKYIDNYNVFSVQGGKPGKWVKQEFIITKPLPADTGRLDIYLVNMAPRKGVCYRIDDIAIIPVKKAEPVVNIVFPDAELYAGNELNVSVDANDSKEKVLKLNDVTVPVSINGKKTAISMQKIEDKSSQINGGTLTLVVYKDEKVVHTFSDKIVDNKSTVSFKPAAGDYRLAATVKTLDGKSFSKEINYQVLEDPFAME
ncbi:MAG: hypothetical protein E7056_04385 [Lentisphaerae bacterium]|nr:hypothetical protein [Lentisphaerota bacterium]